MFKLLTAVATLLFFTLPAAAQRDLPEGVAPDVVLAAFFSDLKSTLDDPANEELGLNALYSRAGGYWIRTSREKVQESGRVPDLESVMFFKFNRPVAWAFDDVRLAGDFARVKVTVQPSASMAVQRDREYDPIEITFNFVRQSGNWYIVDYQGPKREAPPAPPDPLAANDRDTPAVVVGRVMDAVVAQSVEVADTGEVDIFAGMGPAQILAAQTKDLWVDDREGRKAMGKFIAIAAQMNAQSWRLIDVAQTASKATVTVSVQTDKADLLRLFGYQTDGNQMTVRFSARRVEGVWKLDGAGP